MTIINNIFQRLSPFKHYLREITLTVFVIATVVILPINTVQNKVYASQITFNKHSAYPLSIVQPKTEVITGISYNDINQLNQNPNPESIKKFMCAVAPSFGVDWKLVYAIGYHESGNFTSSLARSHNNYFGRKAAGGGYASWSTPQDAILNQFAYIKNMYYSRGLTTPAAINPIYAEDSSWRYAVQSVMNTL